ncbi:MAG: cobyrinate a,c-diamide synthase [Clostridia bacterium]|nr:cobyrinate a,c-diamide synthase [Clostridia bacterium]
MNVIKAKTNRVMISGTGSGCGKTTLVCALLSAYKRRGVNVGAAKCGPDYIDPMFHRSVVGAHSTNLDPFFFDGNTLSRLLAKNGEGRTLTVIEGAMGYYDGFAAASPRASAYETARATGTPVILAVNARGASLSALAQIRGFIGFRPDDRIAGVILNNCSERVYTALKPMIEGELGVSAFGFMPRIPEAELGSRHLGLITADETEDLATKLSRLAEQAERSLDLDGIASLAERAPELSFTLPVIKKREPCRIAAARDAAFCFYYEDSLDLLREMGAEIVEFSPISDERLPEGVHGLILGGGYPELHAEALSNNVSMRESVRSAVAGGLPCIAECGGFMYLTERIADKPMAGVIPGGCSDTGGLRRFGYVTLTAERDNLLCRKGASIPAHEFHHWDADDPGEGFRAVKPDGRSWACVHAGPTLFAGFPHLHLCAEPAFAESFYTACLKEKHECSKR